MLRVVRKFVALCLVAPAIVLFWCAISNGVRDGDLLEQFAGVAIAVVVISGVWGGIALWNHPN